MTQLHFNSKEVRVEETDSETWNLGLVMNEGKLVELFPPAENSSSVSIFHQQKNSSFVSYWGSIRIPHMKGLILLASYSLQYVHSTFLFWFKVFTYKIKKE